MDQAIYLIVHDPHETWLRKIANIARDLCCCLVRGGQQSVVPSMEVVVKIVNCDAASSQEVGLKVE